REEPLELRAREIEVAFLRVGHPPDYTGGFSMQDAQRTYPRHIRPDAPGRPVVGERADDAQHFRVRLRHDGSRVVVLEGEAVRHPWSTCAEAIDPLRGLAGIRLSRRCTAVGEVSNAHHH